MKRDSRIKYCSPAYDKARKRADALTGAVARRIRLKPSEAYFGKMSPKTYALEMARWRAEKARLARMGIEITYNSKGEQVVRQKAYDPNRKNPNYSRKKRASAKKADVRTQRLIQAITRRQRTATGSRADSDFERINKLMASAYRASRVAAKRETNPRKGGSDMAKRRKKWGSPAQRAALKKMHAARRKHPEHASRSALPTGKVAHRRQRRRRGLTTRTSSTTRVVTRRNPGIMAAAKETLTAAVPAVIAGAGIGFLDTKILAGRSILIRVGAKVGAAALAAVLLRSKPKMALATMGAVLGTLGYEGGVRVGGGVIATSRPQGIKELAAMAAEDEESLGLLQEEMQGMGLLTEMSDMGEETPDLGDATMPDLGAEDDEIAFIGDEDESA